MGTVDFSLCWDLGDVLFCEETEVKASNGVTERVALVPGVGELVRSLAARGIPMACSLQASRNWARGCSR